MSKNKKFNLTLRDENRILRELFSENEKTLNNILNDIRDYRRKMEDLRNLARKKSEYRKYENWKMPVILEKIEDMIMRQQAHKHLKIEKLNDIEIFHRSERQRSLIFYT